VSWFVLICSGALEAVWATALDRSENFTRLGPAVRFLLGLALSMAGLAYAMRELSVGTSYAVWVGMGAAVTLAFAMATGDEPASAIKLVFLVGIIGCVVGLRLAQ
jgi:quaternary ammonium compound-resistance protein SugE